MAVFDLHSDTVTECFKLGKDLYDGIGHFNIRDLPQEEWCQCFGIWIPDELRGQQAIDYYEKNRQYFLEQLKRYRELMGMATTSAEVRRLWQKKRLAALLTVEGGSVLAGQLERVAMLAGDGVRMLTLTWNNANEIGGGQLSEGGLTNFGREVIPALEEYGIIIDLSHLNDTTMAQVLSLLRRPPVVSHSGSRSVCRHKRNLTDEQFVAVVRKGGIVGLPLADIFLDENTPTIFSFVSHIRQFIRLGGEDALALGSDFDGANIPDFANTPAKLVALRPYLLRYGMSEQQVEKLYWRNAMAFLERYGI